MNEYNEKDRLNGEAGERDQTGAENGPRSDQNQRVDGDRGSSASAETPSPPQTGYWSSAGQPYQAGRDSYQAPYRQPDYRAPYTPPYYNQGQNDNQGQGGGYQRPYGYGQSQQTSGGLSQGYRQGGYQQYGTSSGWQQPPQQQDSYEWRFEDYDNLETGKREKKRRNRGVVVFTVSLVCVLSAGVVALSGYSIYTAAMGASDVAEEGFEAEIMESSMEELPDGELEITATPEYTESLPVGGKMTIPQVVEVVQPSVVGVIKFSFDQTYEVNGLGSGIVMNDDGYIITNAHVVADGTSYKVQLYEGDTYDAILVGSDALSDLAVLKIEAEGLVPARFGDSTAIQVGETVIAIGNPAGLELAGSVTRGIVSAVNRAVRTTNNVAYIQTDAAINPGNSGGALANEYGQVIGINSSKIVAEGYEGIGFAIPVAEAKPIIDELIANGRVTSRAMLGIKGVAVDAVGARTYGERGILIGEIYNNTDLVANGAQVGDIITHIDGQRIYTLADLRRVLDSKKAGDTVTLTLYRRLVNQEMNFDVETRLIENNE